MCAHVPQFIYIDPLEQVASVSQLFSGDADVRETREFDNESDLRSTFVDRCGIRPTDEALYLMSTDATFHAPPQAAREWNDYQFDTLSAGGLSESFVPSGATTREVGWIHDAHATIHRVTDATVFLEDDSTRRLFVPETTTVRGLVDYRIAVPKDDTNGSVQREYTLESHRVVASCIVTEDRADAGRTIQNPDSADAGTNVCEGPTATPLTLWGAGTVAKSIDTAGVSALTLAAVIHYQGTETVDQCDEWNDTAGSCDGNWTTTTTPANGTAVVVDGREHVKRATLPNVSVRVAQFPDGEYRAIVTATGPFAYVTFSDSAAFAWQYRFYSAMAPGWDHAVVRTPDGPAATSHHHPVRPYLFPSAYGVQATETSGYVDNVTTGPNRTGPASWVPGDIRVNAVQRPYGPARTVRLAGISQYSRSDVRVYGVVRGQVSKRPMASPAVDVSPVETVAKSTITVNRTVVNDSVARLQITLTSATGAPINTQNRSSVVTVGDLAVETNETGQATVLVARGAYVRVSYTPMPWYETTVNQTAYLESSELSPPLAGVGAGGQWLQLVVEFVVVLLMPLSAFLWVAKEALGADTWPPWEVIQWR